MFLRLSISTTNSSPNVVTIFSKLRNSNKGFSCFNLKDLNNNLPSKRLIEQRASLCTKKEIKDDIETPQTAFELMKKIKGIESLPAFNDKRKSNSSEQLWFNQFLDQKLSEEELFAKVNKLETKNKRALPEPLLVTNDQVVATTEKWIQEYIVGLNLCPYASRFEKKRTIHVTQSLGLFIPSEYVSLHVQHLAVESDTAVKLIVFPSRVNYEQFVEMYNFIILSDTVKDLINSGRIKLDIFHPKAVNPYYAADDPRNYVHRSPYATIQLTRMKEHKKVVKDWERKHGDIPSSGTDLTKKIKKIIDDNSDNFSKKSGQKLQFMLESFLPESVIICPDSKPFEDNKDSDPKQV